MRIAVVGAGVSGLVAASLLAADHELTVFEAGDTPGGHALTVEVDDGGKALPVDTGFVVYNETTYPRFTRLLRRLGIETQTASMSFSVRNETTGLEYCGTSFSTIFAQVGNLVRPRFLGMLRDIVRFHEAAPRWVETHAVDRALAELLDEGGYGAGFREDYFLPMAAAVWSATPEQILAAPARFLVRFLSNHGMLSANGHYEWRTVRGGSRRYVEALVEPFRDRIRTRTRVHFIRRTSTEVEIAIDGRIESFDEVVIATHSDQALALLADPSPAEREILGAIGYQANEAVLHTDESLLPRARRARASWNYHVPEETSDRVRVTYDMTRLQSLPTDRRYLVTLNWAERIDPGKILGRFQAAHPLFTREAVAAQERHGEISGSRAPGGPGRTHYCGAYWRHGFHEDGVVSGLRIAAAFGVAAALGPAAEERAA